MHVEFVLFITLLWRIPSSLLLDAAAIPYPFHRVVKIVSDGVVRSYHECMESVLTKPLTTTATAAITSRPSLPLALVRAARAVCRISRIVGEGEHRTL